MGGSWWRDLTECGPLEKGMANHFSILVLRTPWTVWKGKNNRILKEELPRSVGTQYATGDQWRNNSRKNEGMEPKQKQYPAVDVTGNRSKVRCYKEQYCIGTWNVRHSMNQGKLEVVKQEMARVNVNILGFSELKWTGMGEFNSDDHYIYYCGQESLRRNGVAIMVNKRVSWNSSTLATSCEELTHWKRLWCWEGLAAGGEGDYRGWDGWMASLTPWTWVWVNSGSWWWTGRPGMLRFTGSQRVGHDWATELNTFTSRVLFSSSLLHQHPASVCIKVGNISKPYFNDSY